MYDLKTFYGPNAGYVLDLYERYRRDPASVDEQTRAIFGGWAPEYGEVSAADSGETPSEVSHVVAASALAHAIRSRGHLGAHLDPLGSQPLGDPALLTETHGISDRLAESTP